MTGFVRLASAVLAFAAGGMWVVLMRPPCPSDEVIRHRVTDGRLSPVRAFPRALEPAIPGLRSSFAERPQLSSRAAKAHLPGDPTARQKVSRTVAQSPILFEKNQGQTDMRVMYISRRPGASLFLTKNEAILNLSTVQPLKKANLGQTEPSMRVSAVDKEPTKAQTLALRLRFVGANPNVRLEGDVHRDATVSYFIGNDPSKWQKGVMSYDKVRYQDLYPGIDLVFYGNGASLEYDYVVAPGVDPSQIKLEVEGAESVGLDATGDLVITTGAGITRMKRPLAYQEIEGTNLLVEANYLINRRSDQPQVEIALGDFDASLPLVVDPELVVSSYLGGDSYESALLVAPDGNGGAWITGTTQSSDFPMASPVQSQYGGTSDLFLTHVAWSGEVRSSTYMGGNSYEALEALLPDGSGGVWFGGRTGSSTFPLVSAFQSTIGGTDDAYIAHIGADGSLQSSSYLGGNSTEWVASIASDGAGGVWLGGSTSSSDFLTKSPFQAVRGGATDVFVAHVHSSGSLELSSFLGGKSEDHAIAITSDEAGGAWLSSRTHSSNFPIRDAFQSTFTGFGAHSAITHVGSTGELLSSSHLGGSGRDIVSSAASDGAGGVWLIGSTSSPDWPVKFGFQSTFGGLFDTFVTHVNVAGQLVSSSYFGGSGYDHIEAPLSTRCEGDANGGVWLGGYTDSPDLPIVDGYQRTPGGVGDGFVAHVNALGSLVYSTYLGGSSMDFVDGMTSDGEGGVTVCGPTASSDFPTRNAFQWTNRDYTDSFVAHLTSNGILVSSSFFGGTDYDRVTGIASDERGGVWMAGYTNSSDLPLSNPYQNEPGGGNGDAFFCHISSGSSIQGTVILSDFIGSVESIPVEVQIRSPGTTTVLEASIVSLRPGGSIRFFTGLVGTYDLSIKTSHWLRSTLRGLTIMQDGTTNVVIGLVNGDIDGDNAVTILDYLVLSNAFDTIPGDSRWCMSADLDGDSSVTVFDYLILSQNFDLEGDE